MIVNQAVARFLDQLPGRSRENLRNYRSRLRHLIAHCGGSPINQITRQDINAWYELQRRRNLAPVTLAGYVQAARAFFRWCVSEGLIDRSPADHLRKGRPSSSRVRLPDERAVQSITTVAREWVTAADPLLVRRAAVWLLSLESGGRLGELCGLNVGDVSQAVARPGPLWRLPSRGKTGPVVLTIGLEARDALAVYLDVRGSSRYSALWLATRGAGRPISRYAVQDDFAAISRAAGEVPIYPHTLRHRVGDLVTRQFGPEVARRKLNHRQLSTVLEFYHHPTESDLAAATAALRPEPGSLADSFFRKANNN